MIIVGAKGFAKEVLEIFHQRGQTDHLAFYDDVTGDIGDLLFGRFPILKTESEVKSFFKDHGNDFTIGIGKPALRHKLYTKFISFGGNFASAISPLAHIGSYDVRIGTGANILSNATFSNSVSIGIGSLVYYNVMVTHDNRLGDFVELSPGATLLGNVSIGDFTHIGANATVLPGVKIGKNCVIGAGAVVTKNVADDQILVGVPAKKMING
jgi:sugar O-acyltransferase (sialic acid O-acetyltransferase NeuD family)